MRVKVLFFGMLKDLAGKSSDLVELPDGATVGDLVGYYTKAVPRLGNYAASLATAVNREYAPARTVLHDGDEVALLPPVSGGADSAVNENKAKASIVREKIDSAAVVEELKRPGDGAVVVFDGIVRDNTRGRRTLYLDYEAYEQMALQELERLTRHAIEHFGVRDVRVIHRLGRLNIGETSVLIVVAAAHRAVAFEGCRWIIDTLKKTVPIWKKEYFEDGAVWADGEPFPSEVKSREVS